MNTFHMVCFVTLARSSTFHEAADKLYLSQSSFSNNIQTIERELDVSLVSREPRGFALTDAGESFLEYATRIIGEYDRMTSLISGYRSSIDNRVSIFAEPFCSYSYNDILTGFSLAEPGIQTEIAELTRNIILRNVGSSGNAVGILFSTDEQPIAGMRSHVLLRDKLVAFVSGDHRLARRDSIELRELENETLLVVTRRHSTFFKGYVTRQCQKAGFKPDISQYSLWYSTIPVALRELGYAAVISRKAAGLVCPPDICVVEIADVEPFCVIAVVSERCTNKAALRFFEYINNVQ